DSRPVGNLGLNIQCRAVPAFNQGGPSESSADKIQRQVQTQGSGSPKKKDRKAGEKRRRRHAETYNTYIFRVLKQVHPNTGISKKSMMIMNSFVYDTFERIVSEAAKLCKYSSKVTLSSREIQTAVRLVLPGELAKHAVSEGTKSFELVRMIRSEQLELVEEQASFEAWLRLENFARRKKTRQEETGKDDDFHQA
ncbi:hypothetical protein FOZ63_011650, partial [Perkinsus olseni]